MSSCLSCINWVLLKSAVGITSRAWLSRRMTASRKYILAILPFASKSETLGCDCCLVNTSIAGREILGKQGKLVFNFFSLFLNKQETLLSPSQFLCRIDHRGIMLVTSLCSRLFEIFNFSQLASHVVGERHAWCIQSVWATTEACAFGTEHWAGCSHGCSNLCVQTFMCKAFSL